MGLTAAEAADIARRHGLGLNDAAGLLALADDQESAEALAEKFAPSDASMRDLTRRLFGTEEAAVDEGPAGPDLEGRQFVRRLFASPPD